MCLSACVNPYVLMLMSVDVDESSLLSFSFVARLLLDTRPSSSSMHTSSMHTHTSVLFSCVNTIQHIHIHTSHILLSLLHFHSFLLFDDDDDDDVFDDDVIDDDDSASLAFFLFISFLYCYLSVFLFLFCSFLFSPYLLYISPPFPFCY